MPRTTVTRRTSLLLTSATLLSQLPSASTAATPQPASDERYTDDRQLIPAVRTALQQAVGFMTDTIAVRGGYVYQVSLDLKQRRGEGTATATEIWVQPPGTPAVGEALLDAFVEIGRAHV